MSPESATNPEQPLSNLTVAVLEAFTAILKKLLNQPTVLHQATDTQSTPPPAFLDTFGSWDDDASPESIVEDIYSDRTVSPDENGR